MAPPPIAQPIHAMQAFQNINLGSLADSLLSLSTAFLMGGLIGLERQFRQRTAGLRTNVLVAVGAAIFVDMANRLGGNDGAVRVVAYVVSGIGFLGAGVIMREEGSVRGLNTAATLWASAAVGACAGADLVVESLLEGLSNSVHACIEVLAGRDDSFGPGTVNADARAALATSREALKPYWASVR